MFATQLTEHISHHYDRLQLHTIRSYCKYRKTCKSNKAYQLIAYNIMPTTATKRKHTTSDDTAPNKHIKSDTPTDKHTQYLEQQQQRDITLQQINKLTESVITTAKHNIYDILPTQLLHANKLYEKYQSIPLQPTELYAVGANCNTTIHDYIHELKQYIQSTIQLILPIKLWLQVSLPKLSDQKNLTVTVREELIDMLSNVKSNSIQIIDSMTKYYAQRGKLVSKALKYANDTNYRYSIDILDEKQYTNLKTINLDLRNNIAIIYDMLSKNWDNITASTSTNYTEMF